MINFTLQPNASVELTLNSDATEKINVAKIVGVKIQNDMRP